MAVSAGSYPLAQKASVSCLSERRPRRAPIQRAHSTETLLILSRECERRMSKYTRFLRTSLMNLSSAKAEGFLFALLGAKLKFTGMLLNKGTLFRSVLVRSNDAPKSAT